MTDPPGLFGSSEPTGPNVAAQEGGCLGEASPLALANAFTARTICRTLVYNSRTTAPVEAGEGLVHPAYRGSLTQDAPDRRPRPLP